MAKFNITVNLSDNNGNAFSIIGRVRKTLREAGATPEQIKEFQDDAMSGDYDHVLQTCMRWVEVE
ncbi:MAG: hypothetical protein WC389_13870 [Lutibacter sp.]|jgi:hypothetical protein